MKPTILFRASPEFEEEFAVAKQYFDVVQHRSECSGNLVIGRYSVLPFYKELEYDLAVNNSCLINSWTQHEWIANFDYYEELRLHTPETWFDHNVYEAPEGQFIVKGRTNSRKLQWNKLMFAENKRQALLIANELCNDPLIGPQGIIYRRYVPLKTLEVGLNGLPLTNEWRFFFLGEKLIAYNYYWSNSERRPKSLPHKAIDFAFKIAKTASEHINFFVADIAETESGDWILIELNDGQMSGLSCINLHVFYKNLLENTKSKGGFEAIFDKWPGNETDQQIKDSLREYHDFR